MISSTARPSLASSRSATSAIGRRRIEVLAGLVDHEHGEVREQRPGEREALALSAGDQRPLGADAGGQAVREPTVSSPAGERLSQTRPPDSPGSGIAPGKAQVLLERGVEDVRVLGDEADHPAVLIAVAGR